MLVNKLGPAVISATVDDARKRFVLIQKDVEKILVDATGRTDLAPLLLGMRHFETLLNSYLTFNRIVTIPSTQSMKGSVHTASAATTSEQEQLMQTVVLIGKAADEMNANGGSQGVPHLQEIIVKLSTAVGNFRGDAASSIPIITFARAAFEGCLMRMAGHALNGDAGSSGIGGSIADQIMVIKPYFNMSRLNSFHQLKDFTGGRRDNLSQRELRKLLVALQDVVEEAVEFLGRRDLTQTMFSNERHPAYRTRPCRNYLRGHCRYGDNCNFSHSAGREERVQRRDGQRGSRGEGRKENGRVQAVDKRMPRKTENVVDVDVNQPGVPAVVLSVSNSGEN